MIFHVIAMKMDNHPQKVLKNYSINSNNNHKHNCLIWFNKKNIFLWIKWKLIMIFHYNYKIIQVTSQVKAVQLRLILITMQILIIKISFVNNIKTRNQISIYK